MCCSDYFNSTDLHIGVTTSTGVIVEFDRCGLRKSLDKGCKTLWAQSLLVESVPEAWIDHWDDVLTEVCCEIGIIIGDWLIHCTNNIN